MKQRLVELLSCPRCGGDLMLDVFATEEDEILDGLLACDGCASSFPVHRGVPRLGVSPAYSDPDYDARYREAAVACGGGCRKWLGHRERDGRADIDPLGNGHEFRL